jgi:sulfatase maturation enzyme AslB (radical SAM superfamily)
MSFNKHIKYKNIMNKVVKFEKEKRCTCSLYMTELCNLSCIYCYEKIKRPKSVMPIFVAQKAIQETFERANQQNIAFVEILFHGGEPFLAFERIKEICEWMWSKEWISKYICYATTNGTLIHGNIKEWLLKNKHRFVLGLSLDGTPEMHNRNRSDSYSKIDLDFFVNNWSDQKVKMTPSPGTISNLAEGVRHLHKIGFNINCTFACGIDWTHDEFNNSVDYKDILRKQLYDLSLFYFENPDIVPVDMLNINFILIALGKDYMKDNLCGAGTIMRCWTPDGQCLPCHLFYEIYKETGEKIPDFDFTSTDKLSDPVCKDCILEPVCSTCYGGNYITFGDIRKRDPYTCEITKIRALASSWLIGQMLINPNQFALLREKTREELALTAKGVMMIQKGL